jgi:hypothetical protein
MRSRLERVRVSAPATIGGIITVVALLAATGCGEESDPAQPAADGGPVQAEPTDEPAAEQPGDGPRGWLVLTGGLSYDGPFTGNFVCYHDDAAGYFQLEGQEPYFLAIIVFEDLESGTFTVAEQDRETGFEERTPGEPAFDVRGLASLNESDPQLGLWHDGGTITLVDNGTSGSLSSDWIDDETGTTVHSEVTWEDCGGV